MILQSEAIETFSGHNSNTAVSHIKNPLNSNGDPEQLAQPQILHLCMENTLLSVATELLQVCKRLLLDQRELSPETGNKCLEILMAI